VVDETIHLYEIHGEEDAFATINAMRSSDPAYPFAVLRFCGFASNPVYSRTL
jgi:hypothetical protein